MLSRSPELRKQSTYTSAARGVDFRLIINFIYNCLNYITFTASVLLGSSPPQSTAWVCLPVPAGPTCWVKAPATYAYSSLAGEVPVSLLASLATSVNCWGVPTSTCWSYLLGESPSHLRLL
jgi:hypothetical protein